jgi:hypothetical protein
MTSKSLWMDIEVSPDAKVLDGVHECDVAVIGSGIAGISTAYELCGANPSTESVDFCIQSNYSVASPGPRRGIPAGLLNAVDIFGAGVRKLGFEGV